MMEKISSSALWNSAAKYGALLAVYTIVCRTLTSFVSLMETSGLSGFLSFLVWAVQFGGCIMLMRFFLKKLVKENEGVTNKDTYRYGLMLALLSAILYSFYTYIMYAFIFTAEVTDLFDTIYQVFGEKMDSNTRHSVETIHQMYPLIASAFNVVYNFIYGWILTAIMSARIPAKDEFAEYNA